MILSEFKYEIDQGDVLYDIVDFRIVRYRYWDTHPFYTAIRVLVDDELNLICISQPAFHKLYFKKLKTIEDAEIELKNQMKTYINEQEFKTI